ncbi:metal-dependent hydrolase [Labrenzia sp. VG12]|uniref:metal-dependent hydrolase n=1 Tax=Labrenzia sp. VG12 TaxID=2021862 RepID=UPI000B8BC966|nr:metal-dependent hydrolase [Labrenzia sp. VG12]ASP32446.1 hydrolase [Labrenzia sp. VG12]
MDSLTQFVLGAAVSTALLGKKIGPRKAALVGGALGTLPDLDVFLPFDDPIDSFVYHRGWSHSIFVHALAAPVIGEGLVRLFKALRDERVLTYLAVYLVFVTHAMIDAMTVYGTRIFWPIYPDPVGVGSVFIIDPIYTLPLLGVVIWALCRGTWSERLGRWTKGALIVTSSYMLLSIAIQQYVEWKARDMFAGNGGQPEQVYAIAAPFNITLWKVIGLDQDRYRNLYVSLFDGDQPAEIYEHPRNPDLSACLERSEAYQKLDWFSRGYFRSDLIDGKLVLSDLRMGLTPGYAFRFVIGELGENGIEPVDPERFVDSVRVEEGDFDWLLTRLQGLPAERVAESRSESDVKLASLDGCRASAGVSG